MAAEPEMPAHLADTRLRPDSMEALLSHMDRSHKNEKPPLPSDAKR
jgi:hypothetical protein